MGTGRAPRPRRLRSLGGQVIHKMRGLRTCVRVPCTVVPEAGFEPACPFGQWLLRPSSKPVPPLGLETTQRSVAEMRTRQEVDRVMALRAQGPNMSEIARHTGIPRSTVEGWLSGHAPDFDRLNTLACPGESPSLP